MPKIAHHISIPGLQLDAASKVPAYKQVYGHISAAILSKQIRAGQRMPSSRVLAESIGVSRNIILLAYEQLELEGYITGSVGKGSFVSEHLDNDLPAIKHKKEKIATAENTQHIAYDYPVSKMFMDRESSKAGKKPFQNPEPALDHFPFKVWAKCAYKVFRELEFSHLNYNDAQGYFPLREAIASYLRTNRAVNCEAGQIIITNGTQQGLNLIASVLVKKGQQFWMEDPGYINAHAVFTHAGANAIHIPAGHDGFDVDWAKKNHPDASLVYITPSHQFPLGGTMPVGKRLLLTDWAAKNKMWIVEDDYDNEFQYTSGPIPSLQGLDQYKRVLYLGTFSKVLFPGLRIGYLVLPDEGMVKAFAHAKAFADRQNSITDQMILHEFMSNGHFTIHLRKMRVLYKKRQDVLLALINQYGEDLIRAEKQPGGMHLIAWLREDINDSEMAAYLNNNGVTVLPVSAYAVKFKPKPGLLLGYTAFNDKQLTDGLLKMITLIKAKIVKV
jgi:GntR family transcriptional regulator/MocR family aminotransferase